MKKIIILSSILFLIASCTETMRKSPQNEVTAHKKPKITQVAQFKGQQVTGVTISNAGRIFVNFPRWREGVTHSVVEINANHQKKSYPNLAWNSWKIGQPVVDSKFVGVQSVVAFENTLYVLDTRSQLFENVLDAPRVFVFDLITDTLIRTYILDQNSYHPDSYVNDLRVDKKNNKIYFTDSSHPGLIILDIDSGTSKRILNMHTSTRAEMSYLAFGNKKWEKMIHSDGIALDTQNNRLYYHALTGYGLYSIPTKYLQLGDEKQIEENIRFEGKTAAPDGMIFDKSGNLYFADLENNKIQYRKPDGHIHTLIEGSAIKWADTFSIYENYLYFTNSRINETTGSISEMTFTLNKIKLPEM